MKDVLREQRTHTHCESAITDWHYWLSQLNVHSFTIYSPNEHHSLQLKCFDGKSLAVHVRYKQKQIRIREMWNEAKETRREHHAYAMFGRKDIIIIIIICQRLTNNLQHPRTLINWLHLCHKQQPPIHFWLCVENKAPINFYAFQLNYFGTAMATHHPIKHHDRLKLLVSDRPLSFLCMNHFYRRISSFKRLHILGWLMPSFLRYNVLFVLSHECKINVKVLQISFANKDCSAGKHIPHLFNYNFDESIWLSILNHRYPFCKPHKCYRIIVVIMKHFTFYEH